MATTIQLEEKVKEKLDEMKIHPRETYNKVIERMIESCMGEEEELSPQTIKNIEKSLDDIKNGRTYSHEEVKRRLGLR
jgi:predicted transcriptional regulator